MKPKPNKRSLLAQRRPLADADSRAILVRLCRLSPNAREEYVIQELTYDEARQLAHDAGIRRIKGNCRKVLLRRLQRLLTVDKTGLLDVILRGKVA